MVERFGTDEPGELIDPEKNVRVWYIARFLDGFVQSTNIDEVKRLVYGEVESTGTYMSYTPSLNKDKQILAWYYALPHFRYGSWGALLTVSSNAYGVVGITGTTQTSSSTNYAATYAMMNYYGMMTTIFVRITIQKSALRSTPNPEGLATVGLFSALKKSQVPVRCNIS